MLEDLLLPEYLKSQAGEAAFQRGEAYFCEGRVETLVDEENRVAGTVDGSGGQVYRAEIEVRHGDFIGIAPARWATGATSASIWRPWP